jgi:hypothetical protein
VTLALAELETHLSENEFLPWILVERGNDWQLVCKSAILATIENAPGWPVVSLSDEDKAVLVVIIGHQRKGGVTKTALSEILPLKGVEEVLARLKGHGLIYADPVRHFDYWRPRPAALLALHLRSHTEAPELIELEIYFESRQASRLDRVLRDARSRERSYLRRRVEWRGTGCARFNTSSWSMNRKCTTGCASNT